MKTSKFLLYLFISVVVVSANCDAQSSVSSAGSNKKSSAPPHFQTVNGVTRLMVDNKPFLCLAGELHNSSSSNLEYMEPIWPKLAEMNLNTVLTPLSWELVEPEEGKFNFELVDGLIKQARSNNLKIVFLWFGSWKNMVSTYAPEWVKKNPQRFPLYIAKNGERYPMLSSLSEENKRADSRAFAALMRHIKQVDATDHTVIMMQVQNEVGTNGGERDYSKIATQAYESMVPEKLMSYLQKNKSSLIPEFKKVWADNGYKTKGKWAEVFGEGSYCNEFIMAWHLGGYIGEVIKAGKAEYDIPMFVNAAIGRQDQKPGSYPSGGPLPLVMDVWRAAAPQLDMLSPDIYFGDFNGHCQKYTQSGNPLFIPETLSGERGAANALVAFANYNAIGFSPFGIDSRMDDPRRGKSIPQLYDVMDQLSTFVLNSKAKEQMVAISVDTVKTSSSVDLGVYKVSCELRRDRWSNEKPELGYAILIELKPGEFIVAGKNINIEFSPKNKKDEVTGILSLEEGKFEKGNWIPGRRINGDEFMVSYSFSDLFRQGKSGTGLKFNNSMAIQRVKLYSY